MKLKKMAAVFSLLVLFLLSGCQNEETTILDDCIHDKGCTYASVLGEDSPNERMFNKVKDYSDKNDLKLPMDRFVMKVEDSYNNRELDMYHNQVIGDMPSTDFALLKQLLKELYEYTETETVTVKRVLLSAGIDDNYIMTYNSNKSSLHVYNIVGEPFNVNISLFNDEIKNIMDNDFTEFSVSLIFEDGVQMILSTQYTADVFTGYNLSFSGCTNNTICTEEVMDEIFVSLQELFPTRNIEIN